MTDLCLIVLGHFKIAACDETAIHCRVVTAAQNTGCSFKSMTYQNYHHD